MKEKLAATLLNHWYCIKRIKELQSATKKLDLPGPEKYKEWLDGISTATVEKLRQVDDHYCKQNRKIFSAIATLIVRQSKIPDASCTSANHSSTITIMLKPPLQTQEAYDAFTKALSCPNQHLEVLSILATPHKTEMVEKTDKDSGDISKELMLKYEIECSPFDFHRNMFVLEKEIYQILEDYKRECRLLQSLSSKITGNDESEILKKRAHIVVESIDELKFYLEETQDAKDERILRMRLEEEFRKNLKHVKEVAVGTDTVTYNYTDGSITRIDLDVLTEW